MTRAPEKILPSVRILILIASLVGGGLISWITTGSILPHDPQSSMVFQNGLLLVVLGTTLLETHYTKPADSLVNALTGIVTLVGVKSVAPHGAWWLVFGYCAIVLVLAGACIFASTDLRITGWRRTVANLTYRPSVQMGAARILFSVLFLFGFFSFYSLQSDQAVYFILFWSLYVVIWPLHLPQFMSSLLRPSPKIDPIGYVVRSDWPGLVRVRLSSSDGWNYSSPKVMQQADGCQRVLLPLFSVSHGEQLIGTGLCAEEIAPKEIGLDVAGVYDIPLKQNPSETAIAQRFGGRVSSKLLGFVVEGSEIGTLT